MHFVTHPPITLCAEACGLVPRHYTLLLLLCQGYKKGLYEAIFDTYFLKNRLKLLFEDAIQIHIVEYLFLYQTIRNDI